jgi:hypothetical protein
MAACSPSELVAEAKCFLCLSEKELDLVMVKLLQDWAGNSQTATELIADAKCITCLDTKQIEAIQVQLLCNIAG